MFKAQQYYYPGRWIQFRDRTYSAQFPLPREHSLPSCLYWRSGKYIHNISFTSYRVPIYTPGWRAAMWIKCLAEGQSARHWRESNPEPFDPESRVHSNIPRHLHNDLMTMTLSLFKTPTIFCISVIVPLSDKLRFKKKKEKKMVMHPAAINTSFPWISWRVTWAGRHPGRPGWRRACPSPCWRCSTRPRRPPRRPPRRTAWSWGWCGPWSPSCPRRGTGLPRSAAWRRPASRPGGPSRGHLGSW